MLETWSTNPNSRRSSSKRAGCLSCYSSIQIVHQIGFPFHDAMRVGQASHRDESNGI